MKKLISLMLALVLLLSSCGKEENHPSEEVLPESEINYAVDFTMLDFEGKIYENGAARCGNKLIYSVYEDLIDENGYHVEGSYKLYSTNLDGSGYTLLEPEFPELEQLFREYKKIEEDRELTAEEKESYRSKMSFDVMPMPNGKIFLSIIFEAYTDFSNIFSPKTYYEYHFYEMDENGNTKYLCAPEYEIEEMFLNDIKFDKNGNFISRTSKDVLVFNPDGTFKGKIPLDDYASFVTSSEGELFVQYVFGNDMYCVDTENMKIKKESKISVPFSSGTAIDGFGEYQFLWNTGVYLAGYNAETETWDKLLTWINRDIDGNSVALLDSVDGVSELVCVLSEDGTGINYVVNLKESDVPFAAEKKIITLACTGLDEGVAQQIVSFNRRSEEYRIEVRDYSVYNTTENWGGMNRLTAEIITGNVPDIFCTDSMPIENYISLGILEDLWPYIEKDEELGGREALIEPLFKSLERNGKLYQVAQSFMLYSVVAPESLVGSEPGWSIAEATEIWDSLPEDSYFFGTYFAKWNALNIFMYEMNSDFVNYDKAKCYFDSKKFTELLEFCNRFPDEIPNMNTDISETDLYKEGKLLVRSATVHSIEYFLREEIICGESQTYIGNPGTSGNGSAFGVNDGFAMSAKCENKEGAWEFMRMILLEDYQKRQHSGGYYFGLPTNKKVLDYLIEDAMTPDYWGSEDKKFRFWFGENGDISVSRGAMTEEEKEEFLDLIYGTTCRRYGDDKILTIVQEEAAEYFAGNCTAKEAAERIQSRAEIYLAEQK